MLAYLGYVPALVVLATSTHLVVALVAWLVWDGVYSLAISNGITIRQQVTPDHLQGRVGTTGRMIAWGGAPLGALAGGVLAETTDARTAYLVLAAPVLVGLALIASSPVRTYRG